jgi:hypothetical protein
MSPDEKLDAHLAGLSQLDSVVYLLAVIVAQHRLIEAEHQNWLEQQRVHPKHKENCHGKKEIKDQAKVDHRRIAL